MKQRPDLPEIDRQLGELSRRLRILRARRRMSRRELATESGISERYLARLECGQANPSLALLWHLARSLDVQFQDLIGDRSGTAAVHLKAG